MLEYAKNINDIMIENIDQRLFAILGIDTVEKGYHFSINKTYDQIDAYVDIDLFEDAATNNSILNNGKPFSIKSFAKELLDIAVFVCECCQLTVLGTLVSPIINLYDCQSNKHIWSGPLSALDTKEVCGLYEAAETEFSVKK